MNDKQNKDHKGRRLFSIDGISKSSRPVKNKSNFDFNQNHSEQAEGSRKMLDDFNRPEGFNATTSKRSSTIELAPKRPKYDDPGKKVGFLARLRKKNRNKYGRVDSFDKKQRRKKRLKIAGIIFLILLTLFGFLVAKGYINLRKVLSGGGSAAALDENVDPSRLNREGDGRINILLLGRGGLGHEGADLTDTIILVSIDPVSKEAGLVSIPRDLYVRVPGEGLMKINSVFYTGKMRVLNKNYKKTAEVKKQAENAGFDLMDDTVEEVLGIPVNYHAMVDFSGFKQAIDTVGGVDVNVPKPVRELMRIDGRNYLLNEKPGPKHFGGFEALAYARSRHTSKRGDFDRAERQRLIIVALKEKVFSLGTFSNPAKISSLLDQFGSHVQTNFSTDDLSKLYELGKKIDGSKMTSIGLADPPNNYVKTANIGGLSVVVPTAGLNNYNDIHSYIRNTLRDSFLKKENASVMVLNGTNRPGLATTKADELKSYGYRVTKVENAPKTTYSKTIVVDMRRNGVDNKYTRNYLEKRFKVTATNNLPDNSIQTDTADFVIILGNDI